MSASPPTLHDLPQGTGAGPETQAILTANLLGDDSDEDDDVPASPQPAVDASAAVNEAAAVDTQEDNDTNGNDAAGSVSPAPADDAGGLASASDESEDDYDPAAAAAKMKKNKKGKKRGSDDEGADDDGDNEAARQRKKEKRRKKDRAARAGKRGRDELGDEDAQVLEADQEQEFDDETRRRMERESRIDAIGKSKKQVRRRKKGEEDIMDSAYEETCTNLRIRMVQAVERDMQSRSRHEPALAKLGLLEEVMSVLRNQTMWQAIVDSQLLEAVRLWLEPSYLETDEPGHKWSLPAVNIQKAFFDILPKMDLDTPTLKESRLGPVVLFYTKSTRPDNEIKRAAEELVQTWSRPIVKRPNDFRVRHVEQAPPAAQGDVDMDAEGEDDDDDEGEEGEDAEARRARRAARNSSQGQSQSQGTQSQGRKVPLRFDTRKATEENKGRKGARLPIIKPAQYTIAPESRTNHASGSAQENAARVQQDNRKFNKFARSLKLASKR